ncbi:MAG: type II secretion system protein GspL [Parashewanella sp.]
MSERLFIRLGSQAEQPCNWLVWSEQEQEIIASGELANAQQLNSLSERAGNRPVDVLVPASAMTLTQVALPEKGQRQAIKALPFMLEESLAEDVDGLHFVTGPKSGNKISVAVVSHVQMQTWIEWLTDAGLIVKRLLPDCLALPLMDCQWASLSIGDELLIRTGEGLGQCVPMTWQQTVLPRLLPMQDAENEQDKITIANYCDLELAGTELHPQPLELPMLILAKGALQAPMNLLQGEYRPKREYSKNLLVWKNAAIVLAVAIALSLLSKGLNIYRANQQVDAVFAQQKQVFKRATGRNRTTQMEFQLDNMLKRLSSKGNGNEFLTLLSKTESAFTKTPELHPTTLRFDGNRGELRMQISAKDYAEVEKFKQALQRDFTVSSGVISNDDNRVTTTLTLKRK